MLASPSTAAIATSSAGRLRLPGLCAVCRGWGAGRVCSACLARYAAPTPRCRRCAVPVPPSVPTCGACLARPPAFDAAVAAVDYRAPWDQLVADFKFHDALDLAPVFADAIADAVVARSAAAASPTSAPSPSAAASAATSASAAASATDAPPRLVVPIPLADGRLRERGYNQAWLLARRIARRLGAAADARLLVRLRETPHQLALPPEQRAGNVRGAFAVEPRRRAEVAGRRVALVDDVMTTASTAAEAAAALKQAGAASVSVWVFARTPPPGAD